MAGYELIGDEERLAVDKLFSDSNGVMFAHGFEGLRNGVYRVRSFESDFANRFSVAHAQAVSSGSAALLVALRALDLKNGDEVLVPAFTFIATAEAVILAGGVPRIVDVDHSLNICAASLESKINERTKAIIVVHMMGEAADMASIMPIASRNDLLVIEDNAQCCGGKFGNRYLGNIGVAGCFSFDFGKTMTTGEGGMVISDSESFFQKSRAIHDHGHTYTVTNRADDPASCLGFNFRMSELNAAVGIEQLKKLDQIIERQRKNKNYIKDGLVDLNLQYRHCFSTDGDIGDSIIFFASSKTHAEKIAASLDDQGLGTKNLPSAIRWHFVAHWDHLKDFMHEDQCKDDWKKSTDLLERSVAINVGSHLEDSVNDMIINKLRKAIGEAH